MDELHGQVFALQTEVMPPVNEPGPEGEFIIVLAVRCNRNDTVIGDSRLEFQLGMFLVQLDGEIIAKIVLVQLYAVLGDVEGNRGLVLKEFGFHDRILGVYGNYTVFRDHDAIGFLYRGTAINGALDHHVIIAGGLLGSGFIGDEYDLTVGSNFPLTLVSCRGNDDLRIQRLHSSRIGNLLAICPKGEYDAQIMVGSDIVQLDSPDVTAKCNLQGVIL